MDLLTLIEVCSVAKDVSLVLAMTLTFSGGNPNTVKATKDDALAEDVPATREAALTELKRLIDVGGAPVAGLLPATPAWARTFERPVEDLLDPCAGMGIATAMLSQYEYECERAEPKGRKGRDCILHKYGQAVGLDFFADEVRDFMIEQQVPVQGASIALDSDAMVQASVLVPSGSERSWGADRLFFTRPLLPAAAPEPRQVAAKSAAHADGAEAKPALKLKPKRAELGGGDRLKVAPLPPLSAVNAAASSPASPPGLRLQAQ